MTFRKKFVVCLLISVNEEQCEQIFAKFEPKRWHAEDTLLSLLEKLNQMFSCRRKHQLNHFKGEIYLPLWTRDLDVLNTLVMQSLICSYWDTQFFTNAKKWNGKNQAFDKYKIYFDWSSLGRLNQTQAKTNKANFCHTVLEMSVKHLFWLCQGFTVAQI